MSKGKIEDKLAVNKYIPDPEVHIRLNAEICRQCSPRPCLHVCPAQCYKEGSDQQVIFSFEGCLECGSCRMICDRGAVDWTLPRGGFGVCYEFG